MLEGNPRSVENQEENGAPVTGIINGLAGALILSLAGHSFFMKSFPICLFVSSSVSPSSLPISRTFQRVGTRIRENRFLQASLVSDSS